MLQHPTQIAILSSFFFINGGIRRRFSHSFQPFASFHFMYDVALAMNTYLVSRSILADTWYFIMRDDLIHISYISHSHMSTAFLSHFMLENTHTHTVWVHTVCEQLHIC